MSGVLLPNPPSLCQLHSKSYVSYTQSQFTPLFFFYWSQIQFIIHSYASLYITVQNLFWLGAMAEYTYLMLKKPPLYFGVQISKVGMFFRRFFPKLCFFHVSGSFSNSQVLRIWKYLIITSIRSPMMVLFASLASYCWKKPSVSFIPVILHLCHLHYVCTTKRRLFSWLQALKLGDLLPY